MVQNLNQKLESEIEDLIKDKSCYVYRGKKIAVVKDIQVNLNDDYAAHMQETVIFNGSAEFGFHVLAIEGEKPDILYAHHNFTGDAMIKNCKVINVKTPIFIHE